MGQEDASTEYIESWVTPVINELMRRMGYTFSEEVHVELTGIQSRPVGAWALHFKPHDGTREALVWVGSVGWGDREATCDFKLFFFDSRRERPVQLPYNKANRCFMYWKFSSRGNTSEEEKATYRVDIQSISWHNSGSPR